ncbi:MAG: diguanylate cyclase [Armatimonadetes bacterium]|nr:diguanylate cyclase [Armatimonadota bacterium]
MHLNFAPLGYGNINVKLGGHIAFFYNEEAHYRKTLPILIRGGLENKECCIIGCPPLMAQVIRQGLARENVDYRFLQHDGQLSFMDNPAELLEGRPFSTDRMISKLKALVEEAFQEKWRGVRVFIDTLWLTGRLLSTPFECGEDEPTVLAYEERIDDFLSRREVPLILVCQYDLNRISGKTTLDLMTLHPMVIKGDITREDPYFTRLREYSYHDEVTSLYNYRYFRERLSEELERASRYRGYFCLLLVDIANFKELNERYGSTVGDRVLKEVSALIGRNLRKVDLACRYGGDEFVLLLPETHQKNVPVIVGRIQDAIKSSSFAKAEIGEGISLAVDVGVVSFPQDSSDPEELLTLLEQARDRAGQCENHWSFSQGPLEIPPPIPFQRRPKST